MHTIKIVSDGFLLLAIFLFVARYLEGAHAGATRNAAKYFLPSWLVIAGVNMWFGVSRANYSVGKETPMFVLVFAVPAIAALLVLWRSQTPSRTVTCIVGARLTPRCVCPDTGNHPTK